MPRLPPAELRADAPDGECSDVVRAARRRARARSSTRAPGKPNAQLGQAETMAHLPPRDRDDQALLERAIDALQLSARSMHRILRVARTIADLAGSDRIATPHLAEAIGLSAPGPGAPWRLSRPSGGTSHAR